MTLGCQKHWWKQHSSEETSVVWKGEGRVVRFSFPPNNQLGFYPKTWCFAKLNWNLKRFNSPHRRTTSSRRLTPDYGTVNDFLYPCCEPTLRLIRPTLVVISFNSQILTVICLAIKIFVPSLKKTGKSAKRQGQRSNKRFSYWEMNKKHTFKCYIKKVKSIKRIMYDVRCIFYKVNFSCLRVAFEPRGANKVKKWKEEKEYKETRHK